MLSIDDLKKLAEMQVKLLKISNNDRDINLEKYIDIVKQIDEFYFSNLLSEIEKVGEHNQTLEEELVYLEQISSTYEQVLVEQAKFRDVCELYGNKNLELSDLSTIDKEYIDNRKNIISGYLINEKNIDDNKKELDLLSGRLRDEEKKNNELKKRLLGFEDVLRNNFINAEGRYLNGLNLQYVSVISEYESLGYDFKELLYDSKRVEEILKDVYAEVRDADDKLKTAELCYNTLPDADSKVILDEITLENIRCKYKLTMIKILSLLCSDIDNYDMFLKKRIDLFDLIKYRLDFVKKLGINVSVDPFSRTKVFDQIKVVEVLEDNSKNIHKVRKSINELNDRLEEMLAMRDGYKDEIANVKDIMIIKEVEDVSLDVVEGTSLNDIVTSNIDMEDIVVDVDINVDTDDNENKVILDNQVVSVRDIDSKLNMDIVIQKSNQVIKRVNEMINEVPINNHQDKVLDVVPELVIEQLESNEDLDLIEDKDDIEDKESIDLVEDTNLDMKDDLLDNSEISSSVQDDSVEIEKVEFEDDMEIFPYLDNSSNVVSDELSNEQTDVNVDTDKDNSVGIEIDLSDEKEYDSNIFMNVDPFEEAPLFTDRADDDVFEVKTDVELEENKLDNDVNEIYFTNEIDNPFIDIDTEEKEVSIDNIVEDNSNIFSKVDIQNDLGDEMPDAFWTVQDEQDVLDNNTSEKDDNVILSFDEQVALLRDNSEESDVKNKTKVLKLDNSNDIDNKVA